MRATSFGAVGLFFLMMSGCASVADNAPPLDVAGTWKGSYRVGGWGSGDIPMVLTLEQTGRQVRGDVQSNRCSARVEGVVAADVLRVQPVGCPEMRLSVKGDEMTGEFANLYGTTNVVTLRRSK